MKVLIKLKEIPAQNNSVCEKIVRILNEDTISTRKASPPKTLTQIRCFLVVKKKETFSQVSVWYI